MFPARPDTITDDGALEMVNEAFKSEDNRM
jgi:hypothetical protein